MAPTTQKPITTGKDVVGMKHRKSKKKLRQRPQRLLLPNRMAKEV